jgi:hypothetical protein
MGKRASRTIVHILVVAGVSTVFLVGGCAADAICSSGEYPVKQVNSVTGSTCVPDDEEPPAGYVRYPAGKVPKHVDDEWDKYWSTRAIDVNGNVVGG